MTNEVTALMPTPQESSRLLAVIADASEIVRKLIALPKREAAALSEGAEAPAELAASKAGLISEHAAVLERLREHSGTAQLTSEVVQALDELRQLDNALMTATLDALIEKQPENIELRYQRAEALVNRGLDDQAHRDFLAVLQADQGHIGALNAFGNLLLDTGYRSAAQTLYLQAIKSHPELPSGYINLANLWLSQGDYAPAKSYYESALTLDPDLAEAHRGLSYVLSSLGDEPGASAHRRPGFSGQALITWSYRGTGSPFQLLLLSSAIGGNIPLKHVLDDRTFQTSVILTEYFDAATPLPPHQLIFNTISDADLCQSGLNAAEELLLKSHAPLLNSPMRIRCTRRVENAARLGVLPGVIAPCLQLLPRSELISHKAEQLLAGQGVAFPLLLRSPGFHTGEHFVRVDLPGDLPQAVAGLPGEELLAMQWLDARNAQGDYHKYRVMCVDGVLYPVHLAISKHWKVHYFTSAMAGQAEYRALEAQFLEDMPALLGAKAMTALDGIRQVLGLDYAGIDFALNQGGDVLLFEANATMKVCRSESDRKWAYRHVAEQRIIQAIRDMVFSRACSACPPARLLDSDCI